MKEINNNGEERKEMTMLLDLKKVYPRVSRPILWAILEKYRLPSKVIEKLKDLHEFTSYRIRGGEKETVQSLSHRGVYERGVRRPR